MLPPIRIALLKHLSCSTQLLSFVDEVPGQREFLLCLVAIYHRLVALDHCHGRFLLTCEFNVLFWANRSLRL